MKRGDGDLTILVGAVGLSALGDWLAPRVQKLEGIGNERQIGWSLNALAGLYEVTRDERYIKAAQEACLKLAAGQAPTGQFRIRWDNRIAFFNGIAATGFLYYYRATGDETFTARGKLLTMKRALETGKLELSKILPLYFCLHCGRCDEGCQVNLKHRELFDHLEKYLSSTIDFSVSHCCA